MPILTCSVQLSPTLTHANNSALLLKTSLMRYKIRTITSSAVVYVRARARLSVFRAFFFRLLVRDGDHRCNILGHQSHTPYQVL